MAVPCLGQLQPATPDILAGELQAPQQGRGIDEVQRDGAAALADRPVVAGETGLGLAELQVAECAVTPVVHTEEIAVARPLRPPGDPPAENVLGAPLQLPNLRASLQVAAIADRGLVAVSP